MSDTRQTDRDARGRSVWGRDYDIYARNAAPAFRWPGSGPAPRVHVDWYYGARPKLFPFDAAVAAADLQALLSEHPSGYWTANLANVIAGERRMLGSIVRREMLRMCSDGRACLVEDGEVWCSPEAVAGWQDLKNRAWPLLKSAPVIGTFAEIAEKLDCSEVSAHTVTWIMCQADHDVWDKYAQHFVTGRAPQPVA